MSARPIDPVRRAQLAVRRWTYGCGFLVIVGLGIAIAALVVALDTQKTVNIQAGVQSRLLDLAVIEASEEVHDLNVTKLMACNDELYLHDKSACVCASLWCAPNVDACGRFATPKLGLVCEPCDVGKGGVPCFKDA